VSARLEPRRLLVPGAAVALTAIAAVVAAGVPAATSPGPLPAGPATLEIQAISPPAISPRVAAVAVGAISSGLRSDPGVASVTRLGGTTTLVVAFRTHDAHDAQLAIARIESEIDPGPLRLAYSAPALELRDARTSIQGDLGRLELLIAPLVLIVLVGFMGLRGMTLAVLSGTIAIAAALVAIRLTNGYLFAIAPAAAIGLAQAIELSGLFVGAVRDEALVARPGAAGRALRAWLHPAALTTATRALIPLALIATGFEGAGSIAVAVAVAAIAGFVAVALFAGLVSGALGGEQTGSGQEGGAGRRMRAAPRWIAGNRRRLAMAIVLPLALSAVLAFPVTHALFEALVGRSGGDLVRGLAMAAVLAALGLGALLALGRGNLARLRIAATAPHALVAAAGAGGVLVWIAQDGHLAGALTGSHDAVFGGALAVSIVAITAIAAGRAAMGAFIAHREARIVGAVGAAEVAAGMTLPAAAASTLVIAASFGALAGAGLGVARETGVAIAAGAIADLVLWRVPFLAYLARWGEG